MNLPKYGKNKRSATLLVAITNGLVIIVHSLVPNPAMAASAPKLNERSYPYVAFGDSITTGSSIATCQENRRQSPWGCRESPTAAIPYPDRIAQALGYEYSDDPQTYSRPTNANSLTALRVGIWGYTAQEAAQAKQTGRNQQGSWQPQLSAVEHANSLVTGSLGINDLHFSDVKKWAKLYITPGRDRVSEEAASIVASKSREFDSLFASLRVAQDHGANVVVTLYYNPYDADNQQCTDLRAIGERIVNVLDNELLERAHTAGFDVADFRRPFTGHGSGSAEPFVFGTQCKLSSAVADWLPTWLGGGGGKSTLGIGFDPHPNNKGTLAMANTILQEFNNAD